MDINKSIIEGVLNLYADRVQLGDVRDELAEMIADAINAQCPSDMSCPCWLAGRGRGLETPREPYGH